MRSFFFIFFNWSLPLQNAKSFPLALPYEIQ
jgi:hypothetical protein